MIVFCVQQYSCMLAFLLLILPLHAINQQCTSISKHQLIPQIDYLQTNNTCPLNSHCLPNNYCACDTGFIGGCTQTAYEMKDGTSIATTVTNNNYTFFSITQDVDSYVILIFQICHTASSTNNQTIDVWEDKGNIDILNRSNALPGGKSWEIRQGCMKLTTPLILFEKQANQQPQGFVLGIKLVADGEISLTLQLQIDLIDFWDLFIKFLFIIGGIFLLVFLIAIGIFIFKWRRRGTRRGRSQANDIEHFNNFMPKFKLAQQADRQTNHQETCAVCLLELGKDEWLRKTICNHVFHQDCLDEWCKTNLNCPICRQSFQLKDFGRDFSLESIVRPNMRRPLLDG